MEEMHDWTLLSIALSLAHSSTSDGVPVRIGHFPGFKGHDAVLISCDPGDLNILRSVAREAVASRSPVSVNERCDVSETVPASLQLVAAATGVRVSSAALQFTWRIDPALHSSLDGRLEGLVGASGHQYFDLDGKNAALVVSVGEYDDNWWRKASAEAATVKICAVEEILRRWDPIGVEPGTFAPPDEYDGYAPHIVSMVQNGCTTQELAAHLDYLGVYTMGIAPSSAASRAHSLEFSTQIISKLRGAP